jgi:NitT/TauT family transport system substrate-binding protein
MATPTNAARVAAVEHGKIDAAILGEPGLTALRKRHQDMTVLADLATSAGVKAVFGEDLYPGTVLLSSGAWLRQNAGTARRLDRAVQRSLRWCHEHSPHQIAERIPAAIRIEHRSTYEEAIERVIPAISTDGVMPLEAAEAEKRVLSMVSDIVRWGNVDVSQTYTNEFLTTTVANCCSGPVAGPSVKMH